MDGLDKAIEKTRDYGRGYGVEYGKREIMQRLISDVIFNEKDILNSLVGLKLQTSNFKLQTEKVKKTEKLAMLIGKYFPDILMICITGSVAAGYPNINDDIDLMIVTKNNRLWLTRFWLRLFVSVMRIPHRKYGKMERGDDFCFNLWLEKDSLLLPKSRQTLRNAMDSIMMIPILNKEKTYELFMKKNKWISNYLINGYKKLA